MIIYSLAMTTLTLAGLGAVVGVGAALPVAMADHWRNRMGKIKEAAIESAPDDLPLLAYRPEIAVTPDPDFYDPMFVRRVELPDRVWQIDKLLKGERPPRDEVEKKFTAYHFENPNVYQMFDHWTKIAILEHRRTRFSHWNVFNRIRWEHAIEAEDPDADFKISNDYLGLYARLWMERNRNHIDFFQTKLRSSERDLIEHLGITVEAAV